LPAFAQPEHREWEVAGFGGGSFLGDHEFSTPVSIIGSPDSRAIGVHYGAGGMAGVRVEQNVANHWAFSLEYTWANQPLTFTNLTPNIQSVSVGHNVHHLSYSTMFLPVKFTHRLRPYGTAGIGTSLFVITGRSRNDFLDVTGFRLRDS